MLGYKSIINQYNLNRTNNFFWPFDHLVTRGMMKGTHSRGRSKEKIAEVCTRTFFKTWQVAGGKKGIRGVEEHDQQCCKAWHQIMAHGDDETINT